MLEFFSAWVRSTMWGLHAAPPAIAIQAMQAMNASARNAVFAPAFFGTPIALADRPCWWRRPSPSACACRAVQHYIGETDCSAICAIMLA
jgi:uncharacterized membrane protein